MKQYKQIFKRVLDLLLQANTVTEISYPILLGENIYESLSSFEKEMMDAVIEELGAIQKAREMISTTIQINTGQYKTSVLKVYYFLEKYYSEINNDDWTEIALQMSEFETPLESQLIIAVVGELERVFKERYVLI